MFASVVYFVALLAACSCQRRLPVAILEYANVSGIFFRYYPNNVGQYEDVPLQSGERILNETMFDKTRRTIFYVPNWDEGVDSTSVQEIVEAYLDNLNKNIVVFDWSSVKSRNTYFAITAGIQDVGETFGKELCELFKAGLDPKKTELIGHYLGAHVAGQAGGTARQTCSQTIRRILALEACTSKVQFPVELYRPINDNDAEQTISIQISYLNINVYRRTAKLNFYANYATPYELGCFRETLINCRASFTLPESCFAARTWQVYAASISNEELFLAAKTNDFDIFSLQSCAQNNTRNVIYMGEDGYENNSGKYYLSISDEYPYGKGVGGLCV